MQLRKVTLIMEQMQMKMEQGLEVYSSSKNSEEQKRRASAISRTMLKCQKITKRVVAATNLDVTSISDPRKAMLKDEVLSLEDDYKNEKYSTEGALSCLKQVVGRLRSVEETFEFHSHIVADRASLVESTNQAGKTNNVMMIHSMICISPIASQMAILRMDRRRFPHFRLFYQIVSSKVF